MNDRCCSEKNKIKEYFFYCKKLHKYAKEKAFYLNEKEKTEHISHMVSFVVTTAICFFFFKEQRIYVMSEIENVIL